ncbi:MAG: 2Fe-2S iron-sulfur cluster-binding protein [Bacteroidales bacterium]|jgi:predicted molibdopterin-dependent oxidoreductase YjgC
MVNLKLDNRELTALDGMTILDLAKREGIYIPTLCHSDQVEHYTSCMVCLVKEKKSGKFLASCSARVLEGMDIETGIPDVISLRRRSVELLLSEHRADCEAPCRIVCPAGYNIPLMNRLLAAGNPEKARTISREQVNSEKLWCFTCPGYCQNACKRKKIDRPISIKNLQIFISGNNYPVPTTDPPAKPEKRRKQFSSLTGKVSESELKEWLKETDDKILRYSTITDDDVAASEASACMHCDCRASENCSLRELADEMTIKDPRGKIINGEAVKKINRKTNLIFENAKCIKCGLCVRICEESPAEPALCFLYRGFVSILSEPLTLGFEEVLLSKTKECIEICPTGALSWFKTDPADEIDL